MNKSKNNYKKGKDIKKESYKSYYIFEEIKKLIENINYEINLLKLSNIDNNILNKYNDVIKIKDNISILNSDNFIFITYSELEILIRLYVIDIKESINNKKMVKNYKNIYKLYNEKDINDKTFNKKLCEYVNGKNPGSGIIPKLTKFILNDGVIFN